MSFGAKTKLKPREVYVEFFGDPSDDKEHYKRYCGTEPFKPVGHDAEVIHYIEYSAFEKALKSASAAMTYAYEDHVDQYYLNVKAEIDALLDPNNETKGAP